MSKINILGRQLKWTYGIITATHSVCTAGCTLERSGIDSWTTHIWDMFIMPTTIKHNSD